MVRPTVSAGIALATLTLFLPVPASADYSITVFAFATPETVSIGDRVEIHVEAYLWGDPVDLDNLTITVGASSTNLTELMFTRTGTGQYFAAYYVADRNVYHSDFFPAGSLTVTVTGRAFNRSDTDHEYLDVLGAGVAEDKWTMGCRFLDPALALGNATGLRHVQFEARTFHNGVLADGGRPNATAIEPVTYTVLQPLGARAGPGVYTYDTNLSVSGTTTISWQIILMMGSLFYSGPSCLLLVSTHPFDASAYVEPRGAGSLRVHVLAGGAGPAVGAGVNVTGKVVRDYPLDDLPVTPVSGLTDSRGEGTVDVALPEDGTAQLDVEVSYRGNVTRLKLTYFGSGTPYGWTAYGGSSYGFSFELQTDPGLFEPGDTARLTFRLTDGGVPLAGKSVAYFAYRTTGAHVEMRANATVDGEGNFTISYTIPSNWSKQDDRLEVLVLNPRDGQYRYTDVDFGREVPSYAEGLSVVAQAGRAGESIEVMATYNGPAIVDAAVAEAYLIPGTGRPPVEGLAVGLAPHGELARAGTAFSGTIHVPAWYAEGEYLVVVSLAGVRSSQGAPMGVTNITAVHIEAAAPPPPPPPAARGFLPGFDGIAALAAVGSGAAVLVVGRRRRLP